MAKQIHSLSHCLKHDNIEGWFGRKYEPKSFCKILQVERHIKLKGMPIRMETCKNYQLRPYFYKSIVKQRKEGVPMWSESYHVRIEYGKEWEMHKQRYIPVFDLEMGLFGT